MSFYFLLVILINFFPMIIGAFDLDKKIKIVVSIPSQSFFIREIMGKEVQVNILYSDHKNLHHFDSKPENFLQLKDFDAFFTLNMNQFPFENFFIKFFKEKNQKMKIIPWEKVYFENIKLKNDPHIWLSFSYIKNFLYQVKDYAIYKNPNLKDTYIKNFDSTLKKVEKIDIDIKEKLNLIESRNFIAYHSSLNYYSNRYNLTPFFIEDMGKEASVKKIYYLINLIEKKKYPFVLVEKNFYYSKIIQFLEKSKKIKIITWDPMEEDWFKMMNNITEIFVSNSKKVIL